MNALYIKKIREKYDWTQQDLADKLGVGLRTVQYWEKGRNIPITKHAILHDLLEDDPGSLDIGRVSDHDPDFYNKGIPLIPIDAMAGFGKGEISIEEMDCDRYIVPMFRNADYLIRISGESMIPKFTPGDVVACKIVPFQDVFFQWDKVYVLDTDQGAMIKRVHKLQTEGKILLISENISYPPIELSLNQIHAIGLVIGCIRLE